MTQNTISYRPFYVAARAEVMAEDAAFEAEVNDWYENGDGRPSEWVEAGTQDWFNPEFDDPSRMVNIGGRGYRFPTCQHGMNLWVDHDPICGACEESLTVGQRAMGRARRRYERFSWAISCPDLGSLPEDVRTELVKWAMQ